MPRAAIFGLGVAAVAGLVYGVLADPVGLSWGLIAVGFLGGLAIGAAVARGAWDGRFHLIVPSMRWLAALIAVIAWLWASVVAYVSSQVFYQQATTPLGERVSVTGYVEYLNGFVFGPSILGLAAMAFMAWRSAK